MKKEYRSFIDARKFVQLLNLKSNPEWRKYCKSGNKPDNIPTNPEKIYKKEWKNWGDFLGTGTVAAKDKKFRSFENAKKIVQKLKLKNYKEWQKYCASGNKPDDIPSAPYNTYKNKGWKNFGDWLGTGIVANYKITFRSFKEARKFVQSLNLNGQNDWMKYRKSGNKPDDIPSNPNRTFKKEWTTWGDFLGTGTIAPKDRKYRTFEDARKFVQSLHLKSGKYWEQYCKSDNKPDDIPTAPNQTYKKYWKGMGDWLGTGTLAPKDRKYRTFEDARKFVQSLNLKNNTQWIEYSKSGNKPDDIPSALERTYKKEWTTWGDFLGTRTVAAQDKKFRSFEEARKFVRALGLKGDKEWKAYCASGRKPDDIPSNPWITYKEWKK